jgi:hypothetical protein
MALADWTDQICKELRAAGFEVSVYKGFPLAKIPEAHQEIVRFLKFQTTFGAHRRMYAEGCLFMPPGAWEMAEKLKEEARVQKETSGLR